MDQVFLVLLMGTFILSCSFRSFKESATRRALNLAFSLYSKGLTTGQVGETFDLLYGKKYSTSQISRMFDDAREQVQKWLDRTLLEYYPIIYID